MRNGWAKRVSSSCQVSILGDPSKDVNLPQSAFLNANNVFPSGKELVGNAWFQVYFYFAVYPCFRLKKIQCITSIGPLLGASCRPHPSRKRPTLSNVSNQHVHQSIQPNYNLRYQDSYSPEYPPLHQVSTSLSIEKVHIGIFNIDLYCRIRSNAV